ncbi:type I restriction enzyme S subunit [Bacillus sp. RC145]|uniref:restriction endonuclease subunit S n=1 Tax=Bacillus sp. RC145 TaxID=3156280 RepID=UPI003834D870
MIYKIGDFLIRSKDITIINDNEYYQRVTVRMKHNGVIQRDKVLGSEIKTKRQYVVKSGQFIMSRIDARHGAFGIIPDELDGAIITGDFLAFDIDTNKVNLEYFIDLTKSQQFMQFCIESSTGTTNRKRLKEELFLAFEIEVPNKEKQDKIIERINAFKVEYVNFETELKKKEILVRQLKDSILREAIQGKLVRQDENDETASVLLERIKAEKEQLIKEKKIKKEKPLPQITDEKKPFELPNGWEWSYLVDAVIDIADVDHKMPNEQLEGYPYISPKDFTENGINFKNSKKISEEDFLKLSRKIKPEREDIIFPRYGTIGVTRLVDVDFDFLVSYSCATIKTSKVYTNPKFIYYYTLSELCRNDIDKYINKTTQPNVGIKSIKQFFIPLPPLNEQKRIVEKVNQLMSLCNELEENIEQSKQESENLMKAVLQEAFTVKEEALS